MRAPTPHFNGNKPIRRINISSLRVVVMVAISAALVAGLAVQTNIATAQTKTSEAFFSPEVEIQKHDYAKVRKRFRTKLVRQIPSPQAEPMPETPSGVTAIEYQSGKLHLRAWINLPGDSSKNKYPAILFLHGGFGFGKEDWAMSKPYRDAGFIVLTPMLRGENGQAGSFTLFYDEVDDVLAAATYLSKQPSIDPSHIYVAGHSAGGTLALLVAMVSSRFRAAAAFDGSPDQQLLYKGKATKPGIPREVTFDLNDLRELRVRSPLAYAGSFKCPARLYYSTEASVYFHHPSQLTATVAKGHGLDVEAIQVKGTHFSAVPAAMKQSIAFFKNSLSAQSAKLLEPRSAPVLKPSLKGNTTFRLKGFDDASALTLAGTFNQWNPDQLLFGRENGQWICRIDLAPGKYLYKFVVDGNWILDPENPLSEDDGHGNTNSILVVRP